MRAVVQRVAEARVRVDSEVVGQIGPGILSLIAIGHEDTERELEWMIQKIVKLRIFEDDAGKMNRSLQELGLEHLIVSQFTLYGDSQKGNRPSFVKAAQPEKAKEFYDKAILMSRALGIKTAEGRFQADMKVELINDGPVTLIVDREPTLISS